MIDKLLLFGSLRSKKLLKIVLDRKIINLNYKACIINNYKLKKVNNENYPFLKKTNNSTDQVEGIIVFNLSNNDLKRILFFESTEYILSNIQVVSENEIIKTKYLKMNKNNGTNDNWYYDEWKKYYEKKTCNLAKIWMKLFNKYSNNPDEAEKFWPQIIKNNYLKN